MLRAKDVEPIETAPVISLEGADLREMFLIGAHLSYAFLNDGDINNARLNDALLKGVISPASALGWPNSAEQISPMRVSKA